MSACRVFVLAICMTSAAAAQSTCREAQAPTRCNAFVADLGLFVLGVAYERAVLPRVSIQMQTQYYRPWIIAGDVWGVGAEVRVLAFLGDPHAGPYLSAFGRATYVRADGMSGEDLGLTFGATAGLSFVIDELWLLRAGLGFQHLRYALSPARNIAWIYPTIDLGLGLMFD